MASSYIYLVSDAKLRQARLCKHDGHEREQSIKAIMSHIPHWTHNKQMLDRAGRGQGCVLGWDLGWDLEVSATFSGSAEINCSVSCRRSADRHASASLRKATGLTRAPLLGTSMAALTGLARAAGVDVLEDQAPPCCALQAECQVRMRARCTRAFLKASPDWQNTMVLTVGLGRDRLRSLSQTCTLSACPGQLLLPISRD